MDKQKMIEGLFSGPISGSGQLLTAIAIAVLARSDGWALHTQKDLAKATRTSCRKSTKRRIEDMVKMGYLEERKTPVPGVRLTEKALSGDRASDPVDRAFDPVEQTGHQTRLTGHLTRLTGHQTRLENASAYLPKRYKDKEKGKKEKNPPPPGELVLVATNPSPESHRLDQPAAQPPAVVEQSALLPATPKARKKPRAKPKGPIPADFYPSQHTLDLVIALGFSPEEALAELGAFKLHFEETGKTGNAWGTTYLNWYKRKLKWRKQDEQNAEQRQRYTDASGRPISEREYVARQLTKRVVADLDSGVLDGVDLDTKF